MESNPCLLWCRRVDELERLKWVSNQGIDEAQMLETLTEELKHEVRRHLYLDLIKKVPTQNPILNL